MKGLSGDRLIIHEDQVLKVGGKRLVRQKCKQIEFNKFNTTQGVAAVDVIEDYGEAFSMPYYPKCTFLDFRANSSGSAMYDFGNKIGNLISMYDGMCVDTLVSRSTIVHKFGFVLLEYIMNSVTCDEEIEKLKTRFLQLMNMHWDDTMYTVSMRTGICHGDLSLSNILITPDGRVKLIDFLDVFLESPIQDIVKIDQDIKYGISWFPEHPLRDPLSSRDLRQGLGFDRRFPHYKQVYPIFQFMNLFRILPYADLKLQNYILSILLNEKEEFML